MPILERERPNCKKTIYPMLVEKRMIEIDSAKFPEYNPNPNIAISIYPDVELCFQKF